MSSKRQMKNTRTGGTFVRLARNGAIAMALQVPVAAWAQETAVPAPATQAPAIEAAPPASPADAVPAAPATAPPAAVTAPEVPPAAVTPAPAATVTASSEAEEANSAKYKSFSNAIWMRIGNTVANKMGTNKDQSDISLDAEVDAIFSGRIHKYMGWQANLVGVINANGESDASILDLHAKIELADFFNVWVGRMLVPSDRSNFSGPWFTSTWSYPGSGFATFVGPKSGPFGRDNGATLWGQFMGGHLKYYLSAFNLDKPDLSPLYGGRINISLINPEPGYYHSSTYYGTKDIVAVGFGAQTQKDGITVAGPMGTPAMPVGDLNQFNVDVLAEKNVSGVGTLTAEGAFFKFDSKQLYDNYFMGLVSYLTPSPVWLGYLQPLVRYQQSKPNASGADSDSILDAQVGYVLDQYAARLALGYQRRDITGVDSHAAILGIQIQK